MLSALSRRDSRISVFIIALLSVLSLLLLSACSSSSSESTAASGEATDSAATFRTLDEIKESGVIKIGVFSDKAPFGSVDANGEYAGYDIEYAHRIAQDLGVEVEFVPVEAAARVEFVDTGKVDLILANFTVTEERAQKVDFANPYLKVSLGVVSPDNAPINAEADLEGNTVLVVKGTTAEAYLEQEHPELELQKYEQYTEVTNALIDGRGAAWVTDNTEALAWAAQTEGFSATITSLGNPDTIAAAVAKGNTTLLDWLNEQLVTLDAEKFFFDDFEKTLRPVYGDDIAPEELVFSAEER
ncbi:transporter substrate-binding domain-containing protein [Corynebacterium sp. 153RC1]|uniref:transporter substrate-binding domain-containing protein n=1 Tax=unclassified Corynebacterium TaxID=2624378 RepID=UPI00211C7C72|nr:MULTISPECIES: transporter substrate-binding domain-containing protein [unclassified Corynebacterium]MCQ9352811.1 transporter substrate-binding domain-containing protein [Corynebacterium sp. 209RC1]MCQ9355203.1 transporter substrate-binding domain-containing protein [Corynebacterium sp. 1222RC1]MCQ9357390.1 transporter substrate-binding domain-containing protein [Corynebacterium sp. 122RC1]MCQ9359683.1 transporter substrate-binding domain-containing protein [Corynebacterium sp. 142RC1]MCQ936